MSQPGLESLVEKANDVFIAGGRAFGELCNPETRNSLVARRNSAFKEKLVPEEARNAFAIKSNLLDSETQFDKGIKLMKDGQYADAIEQLQFAYDCEPQNSEYRAELAFCKYRKDSQIEKDGLDGESVPRLFRRRGTRSSRGAPARSGRSSFRKRRGTLSPSSPSFSIPKPSSTKASSS